MSLIKTLAATSAPVSRAELMAQLRLDATADANQLDRLDVMIADAVDYVEAETGLTLAPTDYEQRLDAWPCGRGVALEVGPVRGIDEVAYIDAAGDEQTLDEFDDQGAANWQFAPVRRAEGELVLAAGLSLPALATWPGSVRIRFAAGYNDPPQTGSSDGDPRLQLDGRARQAVILLAATWYVDRTAPAPEAVERLITRLRVHR